MASSLSLIDRLRRIQLQTREEFESSGLDKFYEEKLKAAAEKYNADAEGRNSSSGYQSNDSAPEEAHDEQPNDHGDSPTENNQSTMFINSFCNEEFNRPWHEEVDEAIERLENAPPQMNESNEPTLPNGNSNVDSNSSRNMYSAVAWNGFAPINDDSDADNVEDDHSKLYPQFESITLHSDIEFPSSTTSQGGWQPSTEQVALQPFTTLMPSTMRTGQFVNQFSYDIANDQCTDVRRQFYDNDELATIDAQSEANVTSLLWANSDAAASQTTKMQPVTNALHASPSVLSVANALSNSLNASPSMNFTTHFTTTMTTAPTPSVVFDNASTPYTIADYVPQRLQLSPSLPPTQHSPPATYAFVEPPQIHEIDVTKPPPPIHPFCDGSPTNNVDNFAHIETRLAQPVLQPSARNLSPPMMDLRYVQQQQQQQPLPSDARRSEFASQYTFKPSPPQQNAAFAQATPLQRAVEPSSQLPLQPPSHKHAVDQSTPPPRTSLDLTPPSQRAYATTTPRDRRNRNHRQSGGQFGGGGRRSKRVAYTADEQRQLSEAVRESYGHNLDELLHRCFSKREELKATVSLLSNRHTNAENDLYTQPRWPDDCCADLHRMKNELNAVKERLSSYDLNEWHRHTRTTNPADLVMRRLRSDVKVEFLTQAWCKFYELVDTFNLVPRDARVNQTLYTIHLCEAPGAFVASLNHYLRLNHPDMRWYWKANSLNPYYEGNHLSSMINDDRFMLQTIRSWDFGPDMTGDIMHPDYPDHLRAVCGHHLPHLVTADGSFDCQDKPEEQEKSVSWLHLKETLTALRVLRKGGHFIIKMFTFFECESVCLLFLLQCVFESINVMKPATSKEGNSEVYVVCREYKDDPAFEPFIRRLLSVDEETHNKYAMFPFVRIPRIFLRSIVSCAGTFAAFQSSVIERNIRLFQHPRYDEYRQHFEFVQEKLFERYVDQYRMRAIPLDQTVVRVPYRQNETRFASPRVMEQREHKQGSHADQLKRSEMRIRELVRVVMDELADFPTRRLAVSAVPRVHITPSDFDIRCGKPIDTVTSTQFCHGTLVRIRNELMKTMNQSMYYVSVADVYTSEKLRERADVDHFNLCDFTSLLMRTRSYNQTQRICFEQLFDHVATLEPNETLVMCNFPLLTQFNISVLCILRQIFDEVDFEPPNILYLRDRNTKKFDLWMPKLDLLRRSYTADQAVISFLPVDYITGASNPFYSWIIEANNAQVLREIDLVFHHNS